MLAAMKTITEHKFQNYGNTLCCTQFLKQSGQLIDAIAVVEYMLRIVRCCCVLQDVVAWNSHLAVRQFQTETTCSAEEEDGCGCCPQS